LAAALGGFAVMTKQTGAVVLAPVALWCAYADWQAHGRSLARVREWTRFLFFGLPLALFVGGGTLLLNGLIDEDFLLHIVNAQQQHGILAGMIGFFFWRDLLLVLPVPVGLTLAWLWLLRDERQTWDGFYVLVLVGVLLACLIPRIKVGGAANNLILMHAWLAAGLGVAIGRIRGHLAHRDSPLASSLPVWLAMGLLVQLVLLFRVPTGYLPSQADLVAGRRLEVRIAAIDGEVLMPVQGYLAGRAGKRVYAHQMPVSDYAKSGLAGAGPLLESYEQAVRERRFAAIVDSNTAFLRGYLRDGLLEREYVREGWLFEDPGVLLPISGAQIRSGTIWVPRVTGERK
jgi:hypothetical protein